jgi:non-haem Fe2+, alpha-ketoglutarate-dependent halogenase
MSNDLPHDLETRGVVGPMPRYASDETLAELAELFQDILESQRPHALYGRYSLRDWHLVSDTLLELLTAPELIESLRRTTGADSLVLWRSKIFEKYPGDGPIDWHQEYGYFDGEEVGGHRPALFPLGPESPWTWTVWLPVTDVSERNGVMEFVLGSHNVRYATRMVSLQDAGFFVDIGHRIETKEEFVERAANGSLMLDIDTSQMLNGVSVENHSLEDLFELFYRYCETRRAVVTEPFEIDEGDSWTAPMNAGDYVIFSQRCMHRSRGADGDAPLRFAISARYCLGTTWVYPQRGNVETIDGSNLDISRHWCVRVFGDDFLEANAYEPSFVR